MQTDYERYIKMSYLSQIGWWEADFAAGPYLCSDFLCELLGLDGDTISFQDYQKMIREDYSDQNNQEIPGMLRFGCIPAWLIVRKVREPMAVINPSVSFNGWKPLRSQNKETL